MEPQLHPPTPLDGNAIQIPAVLSNVPLFFSNLNSKVVLITVFCRFNVKLLKYNLHCAVLRYTDLPEDVLVAAVVSQRSTVARLIVVSENNSVTDTVQLRGIGQCSGYLC